MAENFQYCAMPCNIIGFLFIIIIFRTKCLGIVILVRVVLTSINVFWEGFEFGFLRQQVNLCELNLKSRKILLENNLLLLHLRLPVQCVQY